MTKGHRVRSPERADRVNASGTIVRVALPIASGN